MSGVTFEDLHRGGWDPARPAGRSGPRRRGRRDHLPDGRHGAVQPPGPRLQARLHGRLQPLDRRVLRRAPGPPVRRRPDRDAHARGGHRRPRAHQGPRVCKRRDDAGRPRRRGLRLARSTTSSTRRRSTSGCRCRSTSSPARPSAERARRSTASCPSSAAARTSWACSSSAACSSAIPGLKRRVRRGRRRLGAALHVPDGPRLQAPPQLAAPRRAVEDAERVLRREHVRHVPGRLGGVQDDAT